MGSIFNFFKKELIRKVSFAFSEESLLEGVKRLDIEAKVFDFQC